MEAVLVELRLIKLPGRIEQAVRQTRPASEIVQKLIDAGRLVWLVGGAIRDAHEGIPLTDIDLVVDDHPAGGDPMKAAKEYADRQGASWFTLDKNRGIIRITTKTFPPVVVDLSRINGGSIETDLRRRDFTINSIAAQLKGDGVKIVDPLNGLGDLRSKTLRPSSPLALEKDPLRIVRAYRFQSAYGLTPAENLPRLISAAMRKLPQIPGERIARELYHILGGERSADAVRAMAEGHVLEIIFPELKAMRGVTHAHRNDLDLFGHTLQTLAELEKIISNPPEWIGNDLTEEVSGGIKRLIVIKLAALYHDTGKPKSRQFSDSGRVTLTGHEKISEHLALLAAARLRVPRSVARGWALLVKAHFRPFGLISEHQTARKEIYRFCRDLGEWTTSALLLAMADSEAMRGPADNQARRLVEKRIIDQIIQLKESIMLGDKGIKIPISGRDIIREFNLPQGPIIGRLLEKMDEAAAMGEIGNLADAFKLASELLKDFEQDGPGR